ncbi:hypothetical protein [Streptomyces sp. CMB-StM0423]|uniref:hypothetical protein n=1 Tax=Streptomyces sp. CMB-StM0423 TaxID=2059884 RepID=UPI000C704983|nr:hypothetical protein [Streptomyces sp. CMB-StM0423]AUH38890.1 hypothetical protein CXR04_00265 [Streptomyces sp. CMB-StM0423]
MVRLVDSADLEVRVSFHLFGLADAAADEDLPEAGRPNPWLGVGESVLVFESEEDLVRARLRIELWDGPAEVGKGQWPDTVETGWTLPSGVLSLDELTAGAVPDVFEVPAGKYRMRLGWRAEGAALVQLWPG